MNTIKDIRIGDVWEGRAGIQRKVLAFTEKNDVVMEAVTSGNVHVFSTEKHMGSFLKLVSRGSESHIQKTVGEWGCETFSKATNTTIIAHLKREVNELEDDCDPEEAADCLLLLLHLAHREKFDLLAEAQKKFAINKKRKWGEPDSEGVVEHIRE